MRIFPVILFAACVTLLFFARFFDQFSFLPTAGPGGGGVLDSTAKGMQVVVSIATLVASLAIILLKRYEQRDKHWAYATIGTIIGFWVRS